MNLRSEIESLFVWFVAASIMILAITLYLAWPTDQLFSTLKFWTVFGILANYIDNLAVGMWLFRRASLCGYNRWLWSAFGFAGSVVGGALYFLARAYETHTSNQSSKRNEIESLAVWFIAASIIALVMTPFVDSANNYFIQSVKNPVDYPPEFHFWAAFLLLASYIDNLVVGMWLFRRASLCGYNRWLWSAFGFAGSVVGGALYFLARAYETYASNQSSKQDAA